MNMISMANQAASSSSSCFSNSCTYDVFLSFRGEDTRHNFTDHLYSALVQNGINTFIDDKLRRGGEISASLLKAIEKSRISIIVFSTKYAASKWCLDELDKILECKKLRQQKVWPIFYKVEPSDVRHQRGSFGEALAKHECKFKNNIHKVHRWRKALSEAANLSGWTFSDGHESQFIRKIVEDISAEVSYHAYLDVAAYPVGIESYVGEINKLLEVGEESVRMVGIWGTGGIGKTTIAKAVYNSIVHKFDGSCFLANVRENSMPHGGLVQLQETLLIDILRVKKLKVTNIDKGVAMIKNRLSNKKVLLILDDVNQLEQLHSLARGSDWFGSGSRIIITTRDKHLLTAHQVYLIYKVKVLDYHEALKLFSWNAFKRNVPPSDYVKVARRAVHYVQGLPLALTVLGSHLCGRSIDQWQASLDSYKRVPNKEIQEILKISFDALEDIAKEIFLHIACFFKGKYVDYVTQMLECCDLNPMIGIELLVEKALITIDGCRVLMHDLLEEMGKEIVRQESPNNPGKRSRLWFHEDVDHVLTENTGTDTIKAIMIKVPESYNQICLNAKSFSKMKSLNLFVNYDAHFSGNIDYLSNELRWLDWPGCSLQSLPSNFHPKKLAVLNMPQSCITRLWEGFKNLPKLTSVNFEGRKFLEKIPDFTGVTNLEKLNLDYCTSLVEVHPSVGFLDKLVMLSLKGCSNLMKFPAQISLKSLEVMELGNCFRLENFPVIVEKMESLRYMNLQGTAIKELHSSIGYLIGLEELYLSNCKDLTTLPCSIYELQDLKVLDLHCCKRLREIPELPPTIRWLVASDCESLERFSKLSKTFKHTEESRGIYWMNLSNCYRLCSNLGHGVAKIENVLLNQASSDHDSAFDVVLPGYEVPEWFPYHKCELLVETPRYRRDICEFSFEIPATVQLESTGLAFCAVFKVVQNTGWHFGATISISDVCLNRDYEFFSYSRKTTSAHVWLKYIPLRTWKKSQIFETQPRFRPYTCEVRFFFGSARPVFLKSSSVDLLLVCDQDNLNYGMAVNNQQEELLSESSKLMNRQKRNLQQRASVLMKIDDTNIEHQQENPLNLSSEPTNPRKRKHNEERRHRRKQKDVEEQPSTSTSPMI
ncbi:unnamed protein product [Prunus brigantina]